MSTTTASSHAFALAPRRAWYLDLAKEAAIPPAEDGVLERLERFDLIYRTLCGILYNFVPTSGHPGGSISSGRIVAGLLFQTMEYDFTDPERQDSDILSYAAGHKAMGLYAMWALRNEVVRVGRPQLLPSARRQLRLEDLLGFRRNPTNDTPLFLEHKAKPLDGHPTPFTPFVRLATGASGVGVPTSLGLALGAMDAFGPEACPRVHLLEGEGGMTPGRVSEALATASAAQLANSFLHVDWNQASIDSNRVCRDAHGPGDYVQWDPAEFAFLHDWNVIRVPDGSDFRQVLAAQRIALERGNDQPTALIYRTVKGWKYGIEGRASHGAGHKFCSPEFYDFCREFEEALGVTIPRFEGPHDPVQVERNFWDTLMVIRKVVEDDPKWAQGLAEGLERNRERLNGRRRMKAAETSKIDLSPIYTDTVRPDRVPGDLVLEPGSSTTLRAALGDALNHLNKLTGGAIIGGAADLLGSTSVSNLDKGFAEGFYNARSNPGSRLLACGGICEDAMGGIMAGLSTFGRHIGVGSSYAAFIAALQHVPARLHAIGQQARADLTGEPYKTFIIVCAHAGLKTGEDGPTHADPQALQLLQENFPRGAAITLTPWEPSEVWPLLAAGLKARPAVLAPFVTRPNETVPDRKALGLPPATAAADGVYALRTADPGSKNYGGTVILQESGVTVAFVEEVLPELDKRGIEVNIYYVASAELFDLLPQARQRQILPPERMAEAMGITGFTLPTLYKWITSEEGRSRSLHPYRNDRYPGSGQAHKVLEEGGLHGAAQLQAVLAYVERFKAR